jgi:hypothetical protein
MAYKRDYKKEYENYQGTDEQKKRRAVRNRDRREANRNHTKEELDGKDIHHSGKNLTKPTLRDKSANRSDKKKR